MSIDAGAAGLPSSGGEAGSDTGGFDAGGRPGTGGSGNMNGGGARAGHGGMSAERCMEYGFPGVPLQSSPVGATSIEAADLDGDGILDLATTYYPIDRVNVAFGLGEGTFGPTSEFESGSAPNNLAIGDLNGDGILDLATANERSGDVGILFGAGGRKFRKVVAIAGWQEPTWVGMADLNRDGSLDLVVSDKATGAVTILDNDSTGNFHASSQYQIGTDAGGCAIADIDGDGLPDVVTTSPGQRGVSVLFNQGHGTFSASGVVPAGSAPFRVTAADLDGDGNQDLVVASAKSNRLSVLLSQGALGFTEASTYALLDDVQSFDVDDLDGDSRPEIIATAALGDIYRFDNRGNGTFSPYSLYPAAFATDVAIGDWSGDHRVDVAASIYPGGTLILTQIDSGRFSAPKEYTVGLDTRSAALLDTNDDSIPDIVAAGYFSRSIGFLLNDGSGNFSLPTLAGGAVSGPVFMVGADIDGDQRSDFVVLDDVEPRAVLFRNRGGRNFEEKYFHLKSRPISSAVADINADHRLDVIIQTETGISALLNDGHTSLLEESSICTDCKGYVGLAAGDMNGDGFTDIALLDREQRLLSTLINDGSGVFSSGGGYSLDPFASALTLGDWDADGDLDVAITIQNQRDDGALAPGSVLVIHNSGVGQFAQPQRYATGLGPAALTTADVNADGKLDIGVASMDSLSVLLNDGHGSFSAQKYPSTGNSSGIYAADLNGDGRDDFTVVGVYRGTVSVHLSTCL